MYKFQPKGVWPSVQWWLVQMLVVYVLYAAYRLGVEYVLGAAVSQSDVFHRVVLVLLAYYVLIRGIRSAGIERKWRDRAKIALIKMEIGEDVRRGVFTQTCLENAYKVWDYNLVHRALAELGEE